MHFLTSKTPKPYHGQTFSHILGETSSPIQRKFYGKNTKFIDRYFGCTLIVAPPRSGKSALAKQLAFQYVSQQDRNVIIFDIKREWENSLSKANYNCNKPNCLDPKQILLVKDLIFKISELDANDWFWLTGSMGAWVDHLTELIKKTQPIHHDDAHFFYKEILLKLPTDYQELKTFNKDLESCNVSYDKPLNKMTRDSMIDRFRQILDYFTKIGTWLSPKDLETCFYRYKILILDINIYTEADMKYAGFAVGKLMERLTPYLKRIKPVIICEEASYLFSNDPRQTYKSTQLGQLYVTKHAKDYVHLILIGQTLQSINYSIRVNATTYILGKLHYQDALMYSNYTSHLYVHYDKEIREFVLIDKLSADKFLFFEPQVTQVRA